jgi:hypothetical protein
MDCNYNEVALEVMTKCKLPRGVYHKKTLMCRVRYASDSSVQRRHLSMREVERLKLNTRFAVFSA